jgi:hypothetical protein
VRSQSLRRVPLVEAFAEVPALAASFGEGFDLMRPLIVGKVGRVRPVSLAHTHTHARAHRNCTTIRRRTTSPSAWPTSPSSPPTATWRSSTGARMPHREKENERERERQTDRQTDRETERETERERERERESRAAGARAHETRPKRTVSLVEILLRARLNAGGPCDAPCVVPHCRIVLDCAHVCHGCTHNMVEAGWAGETHLSRSCVASKTARGALVAPMARWDPSSWAREGETKGLE